MSRRANSQGVPVLHSELARGKDLRKMFIRGGGGERSFLFGDSLAGDQQYIEFSSPRTFAWTSLGHFPNCQGYKVSEFSGTPRYCKKRVSCFIDITISSYHYPQWLQTHTLCIVSPSIRSMQHGGTYARIRTTSA